MKRNTLSKDEQFIILSDDGFSQFYLSDPTAPIEKFMEETVGYLRDYPGVKVKAFGVGPGSVFTYDTKVGDVFMRDVSPVAEKVCRDGDLKARDMVKKLNDSGKDSLTRVVEMCHKMGIVPWSRFEMNHEYGPCNEENFTYACLVGRFTKEHLEYRVLRSDGTPYPSPLLDFKHKAVRDFKTAIIKEVAEHGMEGIILDFCVYPPLFSDAKRDGHFITDFLRDARKVLDEVGHRENRHIDLAVRIEEDCAERLNMDWKAWIKEGIIDWIAPSFRYCGAFYEAPVEKFLKACEGTDCRVITYINTENVSRLTTDPNPYHSRSGLGCMTDRPYLPRRFYARAYSGVKSGAPAMQLATSTGHMDGEKELHWHPMLEVLADEEKLRRAEKEYDFDYDGTMPAELTGDTNVFTHSVIIGDEPEDIKKATFILYARGLTSTESVTLNVNGHEMILTEEHLHWSPLDEPILPSRESMGGITDYNPYHLARIPEWWNICRNEIDISPAWLVSGKNTITLTYRIENEKTPIRRLRVGDLAFIIQPF